MAIAARSRPEASEKGAKPGRSRGFERFLPPLLLAPSAIALLVFVYGFIGMTIWISISNWGSASMEKKKSKL